MTAPDLLAHACLLRLNCDKEAWARPGSRTRSVACRSPFPPTDQTALQYRTPTCRLPPRGPPPRRPVARSHRISSRGLRDTSRREKGEEAYVKGAEPSFSPAASTRRSTGLSSRWRLEPDWPNHGLNATAWPWPIIASATPMMPAAGSTLPNTGLIDLIWILQGRNAERPDRAAAGASLFRVLGLRPGPPARGRRADPRQELPDRRIRAMNGDLAGRARIKEH